MTDVVVYAVVHRAVMRFFPQFWASLEPQLVDGFQLCLSLDGVSQDEVLAVTGPARTVRFIDAAAGWSNPIDIRRRALLALTADYSGIVLQDSDDVVLPGRLEASRASLVHHDVYACALSIVDMAGKALPVPDFTLQEDEVEELCHGALLAKVNVVGFGNSAYRSQVLRACLDIPSDAVLMDWLVASRAHLAGADIAFDLVPRVLYRQYGDNTASVVPPFHENRILADARRVVDHYRILLSYPHGSARTIEPFKRARARCEALLSWLETPGPVGGSNLSRYTAHVNSLPRRTYLWWQHLIIDVPS